MSAVPFPKHGLTLDELVAHLASIGLLGDPALVRRRLEAVGYYRLSPYWRYFRVNSQASPLREGATIEKVWELYTFDRQLRLAAVDALERVEVGVRARLVQANVEASGPFGYAHVGLGTDEHCTKLLNTLDASLREARRDPDAHRVTEAQRHFVTSYADDAWPLWLAAEQFTFGDMVTLYVGSPKPAREAVARRFGVDEAVFASWLRALQVLRNICAHYGRLWNRHVRAAKLPRKLRDWQDPRVGSERRPFVLLTILCHLMNDLCPKSEWAVRLRNLLREHAHLPLREMGLVDGWEDHPIWSRPLHGK